MKQRHRFHGTSWESLEDRQLLNGATGARMLARLQQRAAHVAALGHGLRAGRVPHGTWAGGRANQVVPQGTVSQSSTTPQANGAANPLPNFLDVHATATSHPLTPTDLAAASNPNSSSSVPAQTILNEASLGFTGANLNPLGAGGYANLRPGSYPSQVSGGSTVVGTTNVGAPGSATSGSNGTTVSLAGLPTGTGTGTGTSTDNSSTTTTTAPSTTSTATPTTAPSTTSTTTPTTAPSTTSTDPTTSTATPTTAGTTSIAPAAMPMMPPLVAGLLGSTTLTQAEVNGLKQAVDTFAGAYTSGADTVKDKAAADALKSSLDDLAVATWSQSHVATPASVTALKQSVEGFASTYTGGTNPSADVAAWKALQSGLDAFNKGLSDPLVATGAVSTASTTATASVSTTGTVAGGTTGAGTVSSTGTGTVTIASTSAAGTSTTSATGATASAVQVPTQASGSLFINAPTLALRPTGGGGFKLLEAGLLNGPALTADEVNTLKTSVDTFAAAYTAGADAAKDQAAAGALQSSLSSLLYGHWQKAMPTAPNTMMPLVKATTVVSNPTTATLLTTPTTPSSTSPSTSPSTTPTPITPVQFFMSRPNALPGGPLGIMGLKGMSATNLFTTTGSPTGLA